jgi:predicted aspartyl protease
MYTRRAAFRIVTGTIPSILPKSGRAAAEVAVPFDFASERGSLLIRARVNRQDVRLILDTGAAHTILRPAVAGVNPAELAAPKVGAGFTGDAVGREVTLEVGTHVARQVVSVMDLSTVLAAYREKIDGLLGMDFLLQFSEAVINLKSRAITLVP